MDELVPQLLASAEPSIRYKVLVGVLGRAVDDLEVQATQEAIRSSPRVAALLAERDADGRLPYHPYAKWDGAHWVLAQLADLGYPPGDESLVPLREQVLAWLFGRRHQEGIKTIAGRVRRCASQEGNALWALLALGLADERADELARRLVRWQWPDGGWNCDKNPAATHSSFHESLIPLRGLALHARLTGSQESQAAAERAADIFLKRRLYRRQSNGRVINSAFTRLCYPPYWHYGVLIGLKVLGEARFLDDPRCADALDLLAAKRLPDGGWPAESNYYRVTDKRGSGRSPVNWGGTSKLRMNEWVTAEALTVLRQAGRLPQGQ